MSILTDISLLTNVAVMLYGLHRLYIVGVKDPRVAYFTLGGVFFTFSSLHLLCDVYCPLYWLWLAVQPAVYWHVIRVYMRPRYDVTALPHKAVFITGCDSGFGHALARRLDGLGVKVFAGCLQADDGQGADKLTSSCSSRLVVVHLDVTKQETVDRARQTVEEALKDEDAVLWGLVNNAGVNRPAELELTTMDDVQTLMDVNCFGQLRMCRTFLPLLRKSRGRVVNVASVVGNVAMYNLGGYCMSKFAVEAMTSALRQEMIKWGVHVAAIEPGPYVTNIGSDGMSGAYLDHLWSSASPEVQEAYGRSYIDAYTSAPVFCLETDISAVLDGMEDGLLSPDPLSSYTMGAGSWYMPAMDTCCQWLLHHSEWLLRKNTIYPGAIPAALLKTHPQ